MTRSRDERSPADRNATLLHRVKARRTDLHRALVALEQATARPATGRTEAWLRQVGRSVEDLTAAWHAHVAATESKEGLFEQVLEEAPRLQRATERLHAEHDGLAGELGTLTERLRNAAPDGDLVATLRRDVETLLGKLMRHRQAGADLVFEAFEADVGAGD